MTKYFELAIDVNYGYSYVQQIFTKNEINASTAGNITGLTFYLPNNADISKSVDWTVYVGHTSKSNFTSTADWVPASALTQVFSGVVTAVGNQVTITFTTPFAYNNTDNLLLPLMKIQQIIRQLPTGFIPIQELPIPECITEAIL